VLTVLALATRGPCLLDILADVVAVRGGRQVKGSFGYPRGSGGQGRSRLQKTTETNGTEGR
jgi:hypothetical protein